MRILLVLASVALATAAPQYSSSGVADRDSPRPVYGTPSFGGGCGSGRGGPGCGSSSSGEDFSSGGNNFNNQDRPGQIYRHVYVHVAPDEPEDNQQRVLRVPGNADKHVNIIFVKTPNFASQQQTEIQLPPQNEQKTLVYVLIRKPDTNADVKIRAPPPTKPAKPEVYFIRYKNAEQNNSGGTSSSSGSGGYPGSSSSSSSSSSSGNRQQYGAPF